MPRNNYRILPTKPHVSSSRKRAGGDIDQDTPFKLPASGTYTFTVYANMMADGAFGRFVLTLTIK